MTIAGYGIGSDNSSSQQQPIVGYKQTSKLLPGAGLATRVKTTMNTIPMHVTWTITSICHLEYVNFGTHNTF